MTDPVPSKEMIDRVRQLRETAKQGPWSIWDGNQFYIYSGPGPREYDGKKVAHGDPADMAYILALHQGFETLVSEIDKLNAELAFIRRRTGFWGEVPKQEPPPSRDLIDYGYAPGQYAGKCLDCMQWMDFVDKRCRVCKPCAEKRRDRASQPPRDEQG